MAERAAIVTGGTSGIGLAAARALRETGMKVYVLSRRPFSEKGLHHVCADIADEQQCICAVKEILKYGGDVELLVNNAGFGISGAIEYTELADAKKQMEVNFFGTVNMTKAILPHFRRRGGGRIVNVSSVAAPAAIPFQAFYSATKAAINDYTAALANEVRPYGITATAVQPGDIATGFTAAREKSIAGDEAYQGRISKSVKKMEHDEQNGMDPAKAGAYIAKIAMKKHPKPLYTIGFSYKVICVLLKLLPCRFANWMIGKLYA
ncbi:MAG: SDR family NAD(P)-dependent oxidoreductase [Oscillospiraceae bacterium]|nr:SDR family NAD(P)-dependent oxidoreductase [Oscillospiraceae bacterium]